MKISEVAELTGLSISNIRFYERKGLIAPDRRVDSKYRDYTPSDVDLIKRIVLYRKMDLSIEEIQSILTEKIEDRQVVKAHISSLKEKQEMLDNSIELCEMFDYNDGFEECFGNPVLEIELVENDKIYDYIIYTDRVIYIDYYSIYDKCAEITKAEFNLLLDQLLPVITNCTNLIYLQCWSNLLNTLDLSKNKSLQRIGIDYELLVNINNIDKLTSLENIYIFGKFNKNDGYSEYNLKQLGSITNNFTDDNYDKNNYILKIQSDEFVESFENGYGTLNLFTVEKDAAPQVSIIPVKPTEVYYHTHIQGYGDSQADKWNGEMAGTSGEAKRLENIKIDVDSEYDMIGIQYTTHCQSYGWMPWSSRYEANGTAGEAKRLEAIKIQLTGIHKDKYDVYYRVHAQSYGWLGWAKNGEASGTAGYGKRLEGIQIVVLEKGSEAPGVTFKGVTGSATNKSYYAKDNTVPTVSGADNVNVKYRTHVQTYGWQGFKYNGAMSGTSGEAKRLEGIEIELTNQKYYGDIVYTTHVQTYGWQGKLEDQSTWIRNGGMSGTSGEAKRLEAICINLTSDMAKHYDIYYRVHAQSYGWLGWAKNGECSGTSGYGKRLEGIQIVLVEKGGAAPDNNYGGITANDERAYIEK